MVLKIKRVSFEPTEEQRKGIEKLPRGVNLSQELRDCLDKILVKQGVK